MKRIFTIFLMLTATFLPAQECFKLNGETKVPIECQEPGNQIEVAYKGTFNNCGLPIKFAVVYKEPGELEYRVDLRSGQHEKWTVPQFDDSLVVFASVLFGRYESLPDGDVRFNVEEWADADIKILTRCEQDTVDECQGLRDSLDSQNELIDSLFSFVDYMRDTFNVITAQNDSLWIANDSCGMTTNLAYIDTTGFDIGCECGIENIYPNPADQLINFLISAPEQEGNYFLEIVSLTGRVVKEIPLDVKGSYVVGVDISDLVNGIWYSYLKVESKGKIGVTNTKRFVKL